MQSDLIPCMVTSVADGNDKDYIVLQVFARAGHGTPWIDINFEAPSWQLSLVFSGLAAGC